MADLAACKRLAKLATENSPYRHLITDNHIHDVCVYYLSADPRDAVTFLLLDKGKEVGIITCARLTGPSLVASGGVASELVWYVSPESRKGAGPIKLVRAFERWAKAVDCERVVMSCFNDDLREPLSRLYKKLGYMSMEESFMKEL